MRAVILSSIGTVILMNLAVADDTVSTQGPTIAGAHGAPPQLPEWSWGEWSRDWVQKGKIKSNTLDVHYLQTPTYFTDMRIPKDRPRMSTARSFADLTDGQLGWLALQNGFTGQTTMAGTVATWHHDVDFQPPSGSPDMGRLLRIPPDRMHEHGLDGSYIESWKSITRGKGRFLVIRVEHSGRLERALVVVGNQFMYVHNRAQDLPVAPSLDAFIKATNATREQIMGYLDCEFSVGRVRGGAVPWEIEHSTLPWREGHHLDFVEQMSVKDEGAGLVPREVGGDQWTVPMNTLSPREIKALFHRESKPAS